MTVGCGPRPHRRLLPPRSPVLCSSRWPAPIRAPPSRALSPCATALIWARKPLSRKRAPTATVGRRSNDSRVRSPPASTPLPPRSPVLCSSRWPAPIRAPPSRALSRLRNRSHLGAQTALTKARTHSNSGPPRKASRGPTRQRQHAFAPRCVWGTLSGHASPSEALRRSGPRPGGPRGDRAIEAAGRLSGRVVARRARPGGRLRRVGVNGSCCRSARWG